MLGPLHCRIKPRPARYSRTPSQPPCYPVATERKANARPTSYRRRRNDREGNRLGGCGVCALVRVPHHWQVLIFATSIAPNLALRRLWLSDSISASADGATHNLLLRSVNRCTQRNKSRLRPYACTFSRDGVIEGRTHEARAIQSLSRSLHALMQGVRNRKRPAQVCASVLNE